MDNNPRFFIPLFIPRSLFTSPEWAFAVVAFVAGLLLLLVASPFMGFDEHHHFFRAYQISEGHLLSERLNARSGGTLPEGLLQFLQTLWPDTVIQGKQTFSAVLATRHIALNPEQRVFIDFRGAAFYTPVPYIAQAAGIAIGRLIYPAPLFLFALGRLTNLLCAIWLTFLAIRTTPILKWGFFLLALTPTMLFQMVSFSADSFTNAIAFLCIALLLKYAFAEPHTSITPRDLALLGLVSVLLTLSKQTYFVLLLLYFLIPAQKMGGYRSYLLAFAALCLINITVLGLWTWLVQRYVYVPLLPSNTTIAPREQVIFILSHPIRYVGIFLNTFAHYSWFDLRRLWGQLGYHALLSLPLVIGHVVLLTVVALADGSRQVQLTAWHKFVIGMTFLLGVLIVYTLAYIGWNNLAAAWIERVQPRYVIPFLPLPFLLFYNQRGLRIPWRERLFLLLPWYALLLSAVSVWQTLQQYYELTGL